MKIIFAGTSPFTIPTLDGILQSEHELIAVYTRPDKRSGRGLKYVSNPVKTWALSHRIPLYQPESLQVDAVRETLRALDSDVMVVAAYGLLIPKSVLKIPHYGCINIHPSLLPRWRGAAPIERAIAAGDTQTGMSIMQLDTGLDTGDIWRQDSCPIAQEETAGSLHTRLAQMASFGLQKVLAQIDVGASMPVPQSGQGITYAKKITTAEAQLAWELPAIVLARKIRAFNPRPIARTFLGTKLLKIWEASVVDRDTSANPGTIVASDHHLDIATGEKILRVRKLQMPGKKPCATADFLNGYANTMIPMQTRFTTGEKA